MVCVALRNQEGLAPQPVASAAIERLMLRNFRSYPALDIVFAPQSVILLGPNGAGKTNILEAISSLSAQRGLRGAPFLELIHRPHGQTSQPPDSWAVSVRVRAKDATLQLGAGYGASEPGGTFRRSVRVDGEPAGAPSELARFLSLVWLTPAQDRLFVEAASERRRFFDRLWAGFDPAILSHWNDYDSAMKERLRLLRERRHADAWAASLERTMAEHGIALAAARRAASERLNAFMCDAEASHPFPTGTITLDGDLETWLETMPAVDAEDRFVQSLAASRAADTESGRTKIGPHATDIIVHHAQSGRPARECSTGEQKAILIRLVLTAAELAALRLGRTPILLLDEIAAHLDARRRAGLCAEVERLHAQAFMTGTDETMFSAWRDRAQFFIVSGGSISPHPRAATV